MNVIGLVLATDRGGGLSGAVPDALCVLDGLPLVVHAVRTLTLSGAVGDVVVAAPKGTEEDVRDALDVALPGHRAVVVAGDAVPSAATDAWAAADVAVVHDVHRPLAPVELVGRVLAAMGEGVEAVVPVVEVVETVKELDTYGWIVRTVPRDALRQVQTPCAVRTSVLSRAAGPAGAAGHAGRPDPLALGALLSGVAGWDPFVASSHVVTVAGHADAFALRAPADLDLAAAIVAARRQPA
jgi:2-C-methyl-D-erythritol 4-phosphate cytidylyltransferase